MTIPFARFVENVVGRMLDVGGAKNKVHWGRWLRVRVQIELDRPLLRGLKIKFTDGRESMVVIFRYERLSDFCYTCGMLSHIEDNCHERRIAAEHGEVPCREYGDWMKDSADPFSPDRIIELLQTWGYKEVEQVTAPPSLGPLNVGTSGHVQQINMPISQTVQVKHSTTGEPECVVLRRFGPPTGSRC